MTQITAAPPFLNEDALQAPTPRDRVTNFGLRLASLAIKLALTLFMGKFFDLSALGTYGLVFGSVMVTNSFLGQELGHIVLREIVSVPRDQALYKLRDQTLWHALNYILLAAILGGMAMTEAFGISWNYYAFIFILSVTENLGTMLYYSLNARNQQLAANAMLFVRSAAWVPFVIGLCLYDTTYQNEKTVLTAWAIGSTLALGFPLWLWRHWGWRKVIRLPVDWPWLKACVRKSTLIWIGLVGMISGGYIDRYVVGHYLNLDYVGVMTFFYSFINAAYPLLESGLLAFATTRLIALNDQKDPKGFHKEAVRTFQQTVFGTIILVIGLAVFVPVLCHLLNRQVFLAETPTFFLLLGAMAINGPSLAAGTILFACHKDRSLWLGNVLYVVPVLICNFTLIPWQGFTGVGYSAILSTLCMLIWRVAAVRWPHRF